MDLAHSLYRAAKPLIYMTDPDAAHEAMLVMGELCGKSALGRAFIRFWYGYHGPDIGKTVDGIRYDIPILLSAGMDPNGRLTRALCDMSFGGEEVGSTTAYPCEGNPLPRMVRLPKSHSIIVYKGLRNHGVDVLIEKLKKAPRAPGFVLGISIALTNFRAESCASIEGAIEDYALSFKKLNEAGIGDYYTLNISCPNTQGDVEEMLQKPENFERLLKRIKSIPSTKPLYIKMPINLSSEHFEKLCDVADKNGVNGLILGNLNKNYGDLERKEDAPAKFRGGLSGKPCFELSNELLRRTRAKYGKRFTLIGVGGILSPDDAMEKLNAGADLLMLISGMIFYSPSLMKHICQRIVQEQGIM
jgi:dihydroorotate dehydrogenase subfamily 2